MDFDAIAAKLVKQNMEWQAGSSRVDTNETLRKAVRKALRAAHAAGREEAKDGCQRAIIDALHPRDTWHPSYLGGYTDAMRLALGAIRALPGKERE